MLNFVNFILFEIDKNETKDLYSYAINRSILHRFHTKFLELAKS